MRNQGLHRTTKGARKNPLALMGAHARFTRDIACAPHAIWSELWTEGQHQARSRGQGWAMVAWVSEGMIHTSGCRAHRHRGCNKISVGMAFKMPLPPMLRLVVRMSVQTRLHPTRHDGLLLTPRAELHSSNLTQIVQRRRTSVLATVPPAQASITICRFGLWGMHLLAFTWRAA